MTVRELNQEIRNFTAVGSDISTIRLSKEAHDSVLDDMNLPPVLLGGEWTKPHLILDYLHPSTSKTLAVEIDESDDAPDMVIV